MRIAGTSKTQLVAIADGFQLRNLLSNLKGDFLSRGRGNSDFSRLVAGYFQGFVFENEIRGAIRYF